VYVRPTSARSCAGGLPARDGSHRDPSAPGPHVIGWAGRVQWRPTPHPASRRPDALFRCLLHRPVGLRSPDGGRAMCSPGSTPPGVHRRRPRLARSYKAPHDLAAPASGSLPFPVRLPKSCSKNHSIRAIRQSSGLPPFQYRATAFISDVDYYAEPQIDINYHGKEWSASGDRKRLFGTSFARFALPGKVTALLAEKSHGGALRRQPAHWT
jgi:hypothetical protein